MKGCALEAVSALSHKKIREDLRTMKNLKKVISTLLALAIVMSSFVAMSVSAASFKDVADTEDYAEAVNALAALGAINGYEDGTFLPENNITRAEAITMIVGALNMTADAQKSGSVTDFADVNANAKWAAGYVNVGVAQGFISGVSATEFAPTKNVTYAEMLSMLTRLLGYGNYSDAVIKAAKDAGKNVKWYDGAMEAAKIAGIQTGVAAAATADVTRAQVAQLIWNTLQAPKLGVTTVAGKLDNMESEKLNGKKGNDFETLLSEKFDAYVLDVEVVATAKTAGLEAGTVEIQLKSEKDWDAEDEAFVVEDEKKTAFVGKTAAEDYLFSSGKVVAEYANDEWTLLYFAPTGKIATKAVDGTLVSAVAADVLKIAKSKISSSTTDYKLVDAELYVNGVYFCDVKGNEATVKALLADSVGDAVLYEDVNATGKAYNKIMIDIYALSTVTQVIDKNDVVTVKLGTVKGYKAYKNEIKVDDDEIADGEKVITVTKAGEAIELSALAKKDVIAIKHDIKKEFSDSSFIEIIATSDVVTGKYSQYDDEEELYTVDGQTYEAASKLWDKLERGSTYTFKMDPFGRLYSYEEEESSKNFAIVEKYVDVSEIESATSEYDYLTVVTLDGQVKTLYVDDSTTTMAAVAKAMKDAGITSKQSDNAKIAMDKRVIEYSVKNSTGRVNKVTFATTDVVKFAAEYDEDYNELGQTLASTAAVLDATKYEGKTSDYKASSLSSLVDGTEYEGFVVYENSNGDYAYAVLTKAGTIYGATSNFAVAAATASTASATIVDDEEVYTLRVLKDGANDTELLKIATDAVIYNGSELAYADDCATALKKGAAFFYTVDAYGLVDRIDVILDGGYTFDGVEPKTMTVRTPAAAQIKAANWNLTDVKVTTEDAIQIFVAPVLSATDSNVVFSKLDKDANGNFVDTTVKNKYLISSDAMIYSYDMSDSAPTNYTAFGSGYFAEGLDDDEFEGKKAYLDSADYYNHNPQYAFVMVVEGVVTNALVISK